MGRQSGAQTPSRKVKMGDGDALDNNKITIDDACLCGYDGCLFTEGCFGCMSSETCLCMECEFCCKKGAPTLMCGCCALRCISPTVCCKVIVGSHANNIDACMHVMS